MEPASVDDASGAVVVDVDREEADDDQVGDWDWKDHILDLRRVGNNYKFACAYCPQIITGSRRRLAAHFVPHLGRKGEVRHCPSVPPDVAAACRAVVEAELLETNERKRLKTQHTTFHAMRDQPTPKRSSTATVHSSVKVGGIQGALNAATLISAQKEVARMWYLWLCLGL
jgi:hypothetical protein